MLPSIDRKIEFHRKFTGCRPSIIILSIEELIELEVYVDSSQLKIPISFNPKFEEIYAIIGHKFLCEYNGVKLYVKLEK
jgi:hypothetical protein